MSQLECGAAHLGTYDLPLHIAAVFIVLGTSAAGVGIPLVTGWIRGRDGRKASEGDSAAFGSGVGWVRNGFFLARHFGTGIILSTSFIHLLYEGLITFNDPCIGERSYDPAAPAIALAGAYVTFILDFMGGRQRIASVKRQMVARESKLPLVNMDVSTDALGAGSRELSRAGSRASAVNRAGGAGEWESKGLPTPVEGGVPMASSVEQPALGQRQSRSSQYGLGHTHGHGQDQMVAAMAGGGCGDEHDAVFRAEQGWQVMLLEAGIIFHSIMIGVTLGADSGDSWMTLLIVIVFHQFFEGAALGARIAVLTWISKKRAFLMGLAFTIITPIGIAIGVGVRSFFSHSGAAELMSIGVLNSFSAGILLYTAFKLVSQDFTEGPLREAPLWKPVLAMVLMAVGMIAMAVIGKWA